MRLRCWLRGCDPHPDTGDCMRCGDSGWCIYPAWRRLLYRLRDHRRRVYRHCDECGKPLWFSEMAFCSYRCMKDNLPF